MVPTAVSPALTNVETAFTCQLECQRKGDCTQFTYNANGKMCYLKPLNTGTAITVTNATIGPKSCGYNAYQGNITNLVLVQTSRGGEVGDPKFHLQNLKHSVVNK